jgi:hypothetical protein
MEPEASDRNTNGFINMRGSARTAEFVMPPPMTMIRTAMQKPMVHHTMTNAMILTAVPSAFPQETIPNAQDPNLILEISE